MKYIDKKYKLGKTKDICKKEVEKNKINYIVYSIYFTKI